MVVGRDIDLSVLSSQGRGIFAVEDVGKRWKMAKNKRDGKVTKIKETKNTKKKTKE